MFMKIVVTYKSKTGFTKKYAEIIKNNIDCESIFCEEMSKVPKQHNKSYKTA